MVCERLKELGLLAEEQLSPSTFIYCWTMYSLCK